MCIILQDEKKEKETGKARNSVKVNVLGGSPVRFAFLASTRVLVLRLSPTTASRADSRTEYIPVSCLSYPILIPIHLSAIVQSRSWNVCITCTNGVFRKYPERLLTFSQIRVQFVTRYMYIYTLGNTFCFYRLIFSLVPFVFFLFFPGKYPLTAKDKLYRQDDQRIISSLFIDFKFYCTRQNYINGTEVRIIEQSGQRSEHFVLYLIPIYDLQELQVKSFIER